jgi:hypothetical protein
VPVAFEEAATVHLADAAQAFEFEPLARAVRLVEVFLDERVGQLRERLGTSASIADRISPIPSLRAEHTCDVTPGE